MGLIADRASGTIEGTGAAINIYCGFQPSRVEILNIDGLARGDWTKNMPAASVIKQVTAGTMTKPTSNGITSLKDTVGEGFIIGADTDLNVSAETLEWIAYR